MSKRSDKLKEEFGKQEVLKHINQVQHKIGVPIPLDIEEYQEYRDILNSPRNIVSAKDARDKIMEMARICYPSKEVIDDILEWVEVTPAGSGKDDILTMLEMFCQRGLEVDKLNEGTKKKIVTELQKIAFSKKDYDDSSSKEYGEKKRSFEIIKMLNAKDDDVIEETMKFVDSVLRIGYSTGNYLFSVGKWLSRDPKRRDELIKKAKDIKRETTKGKIATGCVKFIDNIRKLKSSERTSDYSYPTNMPDTTFQK